MPDLTKRDFRLGVSTQYDHQLAYINPEFENKIISHIVGNYMDNSTFPLYLAVHGNKGEGKTFQTLRICSNHGLTVYYFSGAMLCGSYEKDSIGDIEENRKNALYKFQTEKELSVFVVDDFHLSIASTEVGVGRTVNSQILTGTLMNWADEAKAIKNRRIPFILLGNDFNNLYEPLTRDGRMDFFEWNPTIEEKIEIVCSHFDDIIYENDGKRKLIDLVRQLHARPVSFFAEIKNDLSKTIVSNYLKSNPTVPLKTVLNKLNSLPLANKTSVISEIYRLANERIVNTKKKSHEKRNGLYHHE